MRSHNRTAAFLYLLARDYVPTGVVEKLVLEVNKNSSWHFTCPLLLQMAERWVSELEAHLHSPPDVE